MHTKPDQEKMIKRPVYFPPEMWEELQQVAKLKTDGNTAALVRLILREYLKVYRTRGEYSPTIRHRMMDLLP